MISFFLLVTASLSLADISSLDGTLWMYEHESGTRHYIAFYENYHYLNSTGFTNQVPDSLWLRSKNPYLSHVNFNGSINYSSLHGTPSAWALNWGKCNITNEQASFNALGMIYYIFIFNSNKPYILLSTDWHPPQVHTSTSKTAVTPLSETSAPTIFGIMHQ
jgi:hypothetical protein